MIKMGIANYFKETLGKAKEFATGLDSITMNAYNDAIILEKRVENLGKKTVRELWTNYRKELASTGEHGFNSLNRFLNDTYDLYEKVFQGYNNNSQQKKVRQNTTPTNTTIDHKLKEETGKGLESITDKTPVQHKNKTQYAPVNTNYTTSINNVINKYDGNIKDIAETLSGKKNYDVQDEKKKAWKWTDRIKILEEQYKTRNFTEEEKKGLEELKDTLKKNKYLRYKKKEEYNRVRELLEELTGGNNGPP